MNLWKWNLWHIGPVKVWFDSVPNRRFFLAFEIGSKGIYIDISSFFLMISWA